jgi:hypothetical protein
VQQAAIIAIALLGDWLSQDAVAAFTPERYEARRVAVAPTIDGDLSDSSWSSADVIGPFFAYQTGGGPAASETTMRVLWDNQFLYVSFQSVDENIRSSCSLAGACGHDAALFLGDVVELFIRESTAQVRYHEFEWSPLGEDFDARFETRFGSPGQAWESGLLSAVAVNGTVDLASDTDVGWLAEARIPLAAFPSVVGIGTTWTFTGARYDYFNGAAPGGPALMMSTRGDPTAPSGGVTNGFHTYEIYDTLEFVGAPVPEPSSLATAAGMAAITMLTRRRRGQ